MASFTATINPGVTDFGNIVADGNVGVYIWSVENAMQLPRRVGYAWFFYNNDIAAGASYLLSRFPLYLPGVLIQPQISYTIAGAQCRLVIKWDSAPTSIKVFY